MPQIIKVSTLIFEDLDFQVPSTVEEYNALDPKRVAAGRNPVVEDAVDDIMKHVVLGRFRSAFLDIVEKKFKTERINNGTEKEPKWESDAKFLNRVMALQAKAQGLETVTDAFRKSFEGDLRAEAQTVLTAQKFTVEEKARSGGGSLVAKTYIEWSEKAVATGQGAKLAALLSKALGREVSVEGQDTETSVKTLSRAIADNEKRKRDEKAAQVTAEGGINVDALV